MVMCLCMETSNHHVQKHLSVRAKTKCMLTNYEMCFSSQGKGVRTITKSCLQALHFFEKKLSNNGIPISPKTLVPSTTKFHGLVLYLCLMKSCNGQAVIPRLIVITVQMVIAMYEKRWLTWLQKVSNYEITM